MKAGWHLDLGASFHRGFKFFGKFRCIAGLADKDIVDDDHDLYILSQMKIYVLNYAVAGDLCVIWCA